MPGIVRELQAYLQRRDTVPTDISHLPLFPRGSGLHMA